MQELIFLIRSQAAEVSPWEAFAVVLAVIYLILAIREHIACWYAAFVSTSIFLFIFWDVNLYMESALQVYYLAMAVYGWYQWQGPKSKQAKSETHYLPISTWAPTTHLLTITVILVSSTVSGYLLSLYTDAKLPWLDSFTTWASIITTIMVARKVLENWYYWLVIDSVSIYLYIDRGLYFTALLFAVYIILIGFGLYRWTNIYRNQSSETKEQKKNWVNYP